MHLVLYSCTFHRRFSCGRDAWSLQTTSPTHLSWKGGKPYVLNTDHLYFRSLFMLGLDLAVGASGVMW